MTYTDVWVGELAVGDDPLDWGGEWGRGNTPPLRLTPLFPPGPRGTYEPFSTVRDRIQAGFHMGKQVDWGAWAAIVAKRDIAALIGDVYGTTQADAGLDHLREQLAEVRSAVQALREEGRCALVAEEF